LPLLPGDIKAENLGGGFYQLDFPVIVDINGTVTTTREIPFPHQITALYVKHTDANGVDESTDTLTFAAKFALRPEIQPFAMAAFSLSTAPDNSFLFPGSEAVRNACLYQFETTAVAAGVGNLTFISMIIKTLGDI